VNAPPVPNRIDNLPIADYASDNVGAPGPTLNSSLANLLLARSEFHAWFDHPRLNPDRREREVSNLMNIGSAAHAIFLENAGDRIASIPYDDWRSARSREMREEAEAEGKIPLLSRDVAAAFAMANQAAITLATSPDLAGLGETCSERTYWWEESRDEPTAYMRCRPDMVSADGAIIISYKTTAQNPHPDAYFKTLLNAGYELQAAFEIVGVETIEGTRGAKYVWLVQENEPPFACSLIGMSPMLRHLALSRFDQAVTRWADALATDRWPAYPNRIAYPEVPAWRLKELEEEMK